MPDTFDPAAATAAYIDSLGPEALARAAAYTTGGHWLVLWGLLVAALVTWLVVRSRVLDRVAARCSARGPNLRVFLVAATFFLVATVVELPWTLYESWWREKSYGRTSQPLADFLGQGALAAVIGALLGALFIVGVYALIRRAGRRWWLWAGGLTAVAFALLQFVAPVFIEPLFNEYEPVPQGEVRDAVVEMAQQAGVPTDRIFVFNGSRQSNNFTANVAGIGGSARVAISDVAFQGATLDEVKAVTGHEFGHYVLLHSWYAVALVGALGLMAFLFVDRAFPRFARAFGTGPELASPTGLPVLLFMASLCLLVLGPAINTLIRHDESAADRYSLETVNLPDALATALVKTAEYRYPRPGPIEEFVFYDHPSVERRVRAAMEWKAAHPRGQ